MNILQAMSDKKLFAPWFKDPATWLAWRGFLATLFHLPMGEAERDIVLACTGLQELPAQAFTEAMLLCGRRSGKSIILAMLAVFLALFKDWTPHLSPGERGIVLVLAADRTQAQSIMQYARAFIEDVPLLAAKIVRVTTEQIELRGRILIEVGTASYRSVRGRTLIAGLLDELAFFRSEDSANPDFEIVDAIRPALASMPGSMLLFATSPYSRRGVAWETYRQCYGLPEAPCLVWQAATRTMNSATVKQKTVDKAYERDPASAAAEYGAQFRLDVDTFVAREVIDAATIPGRRELLPVSGIKYVGFVDPSGGSSDSMTLAVAHRDPKDRTLGILDAVREVRPPFSPESTVAGFVELLKSYKVSKVTGDRYGGEFCREPFKKQGIKYELSEKSKSDIYQNTLPLLNSGKVELLDLPKLSAQFIGLERRTARSGRDSIDHAPDGHDDLVNSACGALLLATSGPAPMQISKEALARLGINPYSSSGGHDGSWDPYQHTYIQATGWRSG